MRIGELPIIKLFRSPHKLFSVSDISPQIFAAFARHTPKWHVVGTFEGPHFYEYIVQLALN